MSGLLSQTLANAQSAEQQIKAIFGLPPAAQQVQTESAAVIAATVPEIQQLQAAVNAFVQQAQAQLQEVEGQVSGDGPLAVVKITMTGVQNEASGLKAQVDQVTSNITTAANQVFDYSKQLAAIESQLNQQQTTLQAKLNNTRAAEESAKQKYYYLLALGPLGLLGLAVALGLYIQWTSDLNDLEGQESSLSAQISRQSMLAAATKQLGADFAGLSSKISAVKNTVDFLAGDINTILTDVEETDASRTVIDLYVKTAQQAVTKLGVDAS